MKPTIWVLIIVMSALCLAAIGLAVPADAQTPGTQPPTTQLSQETARKFAAKVPALQKYARVKHAISSIVGDDQSALRDASAHARVREQLRAPYQDLVRIYYEETHPEPAKPASTSPPASTAPAAAALTPRNLSVGEMTFEAGITEMLIAAEDEHTTAAVKIQAASTDMQVARIAQFELLAGEWLAGPNEAAQMKTLDKISAFLKAVDPSNDTFANALGSMFTDQGATPAATEELHHVILASFPNKTVANLAAFVARNQKAAKDRPQLIAKDKELLAAVAGQPLVLEGTTVDGKPFSSADWKGKVILVDFWATWCGPCKAELPRVKEMYQKYHDQGFEVLGISNDYAKEPLTKYLASDPALAWPNLFDPDTASQQVLHPLAKKFGVEAIPVMFLIDRNGICRTVQAREDMNKMIPMLLAETPKVSAGK